MKSVYLVAAILLLATIASSDEITFNGASYFFKGYKAASDSEAYYYLPKNTESLTKFETGLTLQRFKSSLKDFVDAKKLEFGKFKAPAINLYSRTEPGTSFLEISYVNQKVMIYQLIKVQEEAGYLNTYEFKTQLSPPISLVGSKLRSDSWSSLGKLNLKPFGSKSTVAAIVAPSIKPAVAPGVAELETSDKAKLLVLEQKIKEDAVATGPFYMLSLSAALFNAGAKEQAMFWFYAGESRKLINEGIIRRGWVSLNDTEKQREEGMLNQLRPVIKALALCNQERHLKVFDAALNWAGKNLHSKVMEKFSKDKPEDAQRKRDALLAGNQAYLKKYKTEFFSKANIKLRESEKSRAKLDPKFCGT